MKKIVEGLRGKLLLAMPGMGDPRFYKSVIFICSHDANGAMGLIINQSLLNMSLSELLSQLHLEVSPSVPMNIPVLTGGPVEAARGFLLHTSDYIQAETLQINESFGLTATLDALRALAAGEGPKEILFALGYSGWDAGQLEQEIQDNAWMIAEADYELIFNTDISEKWSRAMTRIGIDPAMLSIEAGHA